jgi:hypothetical protein
VTGTDELLLRLSEAIEHLERRQLAKDDRADLVRLLPAAHALMGHASFTAEDLEATVQRNSTSPAAVVVAAVIAEHTTPAGGLRLFGRLLTRLVGAPTHGLRLERVGNAREGAVYAIASTGRCNTRARAGREATDCARSAAPTDNRSTT